MFCFNFSKTCAESLLIFLWYSFHLKMCTDVGDFWTFLKLKFAFIFEGFFQIKKHEKSIPNLINIHFHQKRKSKYDWILFERTRNKLFTFWKRSYGNLWKKSFHSLILNLDFSFQVAEKMKRERKMSANKYFENICIDFRNCNVIFVILFPHQVLQKISLTRLLVCGVN